MLWWHLAVVLFFIFLCGDPQQQQAAEHCILRQQMQPMLKSVYESRFPKKLHMRIGTLECVKTIVELLQKFTVKIIEKNIYIGKRTTMRNNVEIHPTTSHWPFHQMFFPSSLVQQK
jgi:hypothetical protein